MNILVTCLTDPWYVYNAVMREKKEMREQPQPWSGTWASVSALQSVNGGWLREFLQC